MPANSGRLETARQVFGFAPHPGQEALLAAEAGVKVAACGRRWGKTEALSVDVAAVALLRPGSTQMIVAPTYNQSRILFDRCESRLLEALERGADKQFPQLAQIEVKRSPYPVIRMGKTKISARTAARSGAGLRGDGVDRIIVDEAAYVEEQVIREVLMPMLATTPHGGELILISTPFGRRGLFWEAFLRGQAEPEAGKTNRYWSCRFPTTQNPLVSQEYLAEQREELPERAFLAEYLAEFVEDGGTVFLEDDIRAAICPDDYPVPTRAARYVAGVDFGRRADYTVVTVIACSASLRVVEQVRMRGLSWAAQVERVAEILARWGCIRVATDRTGVGDPLTETLFIEAQKKRLPVAVDEVVFTPVSKGVLIDSVVVALSQRRLQFPAYPDLLLEMRSFVATPAAGGREKLGASKGHDDTVCSLALAVHAAAPIVVSGSISALVASGGMREKVGF